MIDFNNINFVTFFSGIAGIGNVISIINNLSNDKNQLDNIIWELQNYKYEIQNYKNEVVQYFNDTKNIVENPDIIKNEIISKFDQIKDDYDIFLYEIKKIKKITRWLNFKMWIKKLFKKK